MQIIGLLDFHSSKANVDISFKSGVELGKVVVTDLKVTGEVVVELVKLSHAPPWFSGVRIFFPNPPQVDLDVRSQLLQTPVPLSFLKPMITTAISDKVISRFAVLPNRFCIALGGDRIDEFHLQHPVPQGVLRVAVLRAKDLRSCRGPSSSWWPFARSQGAAPTADPYATLSVGAFWAQTPKRQNTLNPEWDDAQEVFDLIVTDLEKQSLRIEVLDGDSGLFMGRAEASLEQLTTEGSDRQELKLHPEAGRSSMMAQARGSISVRTQWRRFAQQHEIQPNPIHQDENSSWGLGSRTSPKFLLVADLLSASGLPPADDGTDHWVTVAVSNCGGSGATFLPRSSYPAGESPSAQAHTAVQHGVEMLGKLGLPPDAMCQGDLRNLWRRRVPLEEAAAEQERRGKLLTDVVWNYPFWMLLDRAWGARVKVSVWRPMKGKTRSEEGSASRLVGSFERELVLADFGRHFWVDLKCPLAKDGMGVTDQMVAQIKLRLRVCPLLSSSESSVAQKRVRILDHMAQFASSMCTQSVCMQGAAPQGAAPQAQQDPEPVPFGDEAAEPTRDESAWALPPQTAAPAGGWLPAALLGRLWGAGGAREAQGDAAFGGEAVAPGADGGSSAAAVEDSAPGPEQPDPVGAQAPAGRAPGWWPPWGFRAAPAAAAAPPADAAAPGPGLCLEPGGGGGGAPAEGDEAPLLDASSAPVSPLVPADAGPGGVPAVEEPAATSGGGAPQDQGAGQSPSRFAAVLQWPLAWWGRRAPGAGEAALASPGGSVPPPFPHLPMEDVEDASCSDTPQSMWCRSASEMTVGRQSTFDWATPKPPNHSRFGSAEEELQLPVFTGGLSESTPALGGVAVSAPQAPASLQAVPASTRPAGPGLWARLASSWAGQAAPAVPPPAEAATPLPKEAPRAQWPSSRSTDAADSAASVERFGTDSSVWDVTREALAGASAAFQSPLPEGSRAEERGAQGHAPAMPTTLSQESPNDARVGLESPTLEDPLAARRGALDHGSSSHSVALAPLPEDSPVTGRELPEHAPESPRASEQEPLGDAAAPWVPDALLAEGPEDPQRGPASSWVRGRSGDHDPIVRWDTAKELPEGSEELPSPAAAAEDARGAHPPAAPADDLERQAPAAAQEPPSPTAAVGGPVAAPADERLQAPAAAWPGPPPEQEAAAPTTAGGDTQGTPRATPAGEPELQAPAAAHAGPPGATSPASEELW
ncbi:unnamed protein product [Prorocentrum cordatum]|uniref:C2 domain-containing protein n=1 Tax=Prorocentrum cordatum TaxID=2364126 RepID=A0ABN9PG25_9DINO|nr:unnamed protein product [Polarella glacialis]